MPGGLISNAKSESLDLQQLPPFLRTLLVTDGTVTKSLEAYFWEPVQVDTLRQSTVTLVQAQEWLHCQPGDTVLQREVRLLGSHSGKVYAYARSLIRLEILPTHLRDALLQGSIGIGELLRETGLETYREILDMGSEQDESLTGFFELQPCGELIYRTYRIMAQHEPAIQITEYFPRRLYTD